MVLTKSQCELLINVFNAGIESAMKSGIPIGKEYYNDIDNIKEKLYKELQYAPITEEGGSRPWF